MGCFRDSSLPMGVKYWYSVTSIDTRGRESSRSHEVSAVPNQPPQMVSVAYIPPATVTLLFNEPMGPSSQEPARYSITSQDGHTCIPLSAILNSEGRKVTLSAEALLPGSYQLRASGIRDATGVEISPARNSATFSVPPPEENQWTDLTYMTVCPNPVLPNSRDSNYVTFTHLPPDTTVRIYSSSGHLVKSLEKDDLAGPTKTWYLDNTQQRDVASGIYIYVASSGSKRRIGKIAIIR